MFASCHATVRLAKSVPLLISLGLLAGCVPGFALSSEAIAFVDVTVIPMTERNALLPNHTVLVRGERISAMGPTDEILIPDDAQRIDGTGRYLMPGLADMHVHLEYFEQPEVLYLFIANGVTTVRNMDGRDFILGWREQIENRTLLGPRIYTAGPLLDGEPPILPDNTVVRDAAEASRAVAAQAAAGYDFVKVYTNLSAEAYGEVAAAAIRLDMPVAGHVPRAAGIEEVLSGGQASIEHLTDFGKLVEADESPVRDRWHWSKLYLAMPVDAGKLVPTADRVASSGVWTVPTLVQAQRAIAREEVVQDWLAASEYELVPEDARNFWVRSNRRNTSRMDEGDWEIVRRGNDNRRALFRALHDAGAKLLVGTDTPNPFVVPGYSLLDELEIFVEEGFTPMEAMMAATREAALFSGGLAEWGTVETGKMADLLLLEANPLTSIGNLRRRAGVMVRGRWLTDVELEEALSRVAAWAATAGRQP